MAASNLYPPIIDSYMPAYLNPTVYNKWQKCRIYFALSSLNSAEDIKFAQLSLINQKTNKNALNEKRYPAGVKMVELLAPDTATGLYYVDLCVGKASSEGDIYDIEKLETNQYYKVQIRFVSSSIPVNINPAEDASDEVKANAIYSETVSSSSDKYSYFKTNSSWLSANIEYFSEWSTVCLIKGVSEPKFEFTSSVLQTLRADISKDVDVPANVPIIGNFGFNEATETDYLKSYRITLSNSDSSTTYEDSGVIYTDNFNPNSINYVNKYLIEVGKVYTLRIDYTTSSLYNGTFSYKFSRKESDLIHFGATASAYLNREDNQIVIKVDFDSSQKDFVGNLVIKRTSSDTGFQMWDTIHKIPMATIHEVATKGYLWSDITVQSGKWYKYAIQWVNDSNRSGVLYSKDIQIEKPVSLTLEDICIAGDSTQVKIKFDPKISSFNYKTVQSVTDTIGSQYPFIRRNGNINYKTFSISGLITRHMDENEMFASESSIYGGNDMVDLYKEYNQEYRINHYNDYTYEYMFRERVLDFLNDGKVKLFRSPAEGNILVMLSNISIAPNETLGRMVYSFTANATEVAAASVDNYVKYGIVEFKDTEYLLQGISISQDNDNITVTASSERIQDGDYVMNAGIQLNGSSASLILTVM